MARPKPILIGCPQYGILVRGSYQCQEDGGCPRGPKGEFLLHRVRCEQYGGRCMQTLCVLHRHNRRGPGSWYPTGVWAMRGGAGRPARSPAQPASGEGWYA
jgi:hypothetical protein